MSAFETLKRTPKEISDLVDDVVKTSGNCPTAFEQGVRATLIWLFYSTGKYPLDEFIPSIKDVTVDDGREFEGMDT